MKREIERVMKLSKRRERVTHSTGLLQEELEGAVDGLKRFQLGPTKGYQIILHVVVYVPLQTLKRDTHRQRETDHTLCVWTE